MAIIYPYSLNQYALEVIEELDYEEEEEEEEEFADLEEISEEDIKYYTDCIQSLWDKFLINTQEDFILWEIVLENILVPNCEYLLKHAGRLPAYLEDQACKISEHMTNASLFVDQPQHVDLYTTLVTENVTNKLKELSIFNASIREEKLHKQQKALQNLENNIKNLSDFEVIQWMFVLQVEKLSRGRICAVPHSIMSPILGKIEEKSINNFHLEKLSKSEFDCLVKDFSEDVISTESLEILDNLNHNFISTLNRV